MTIQEIVSEWVKNNPKIVGLFNKERECRCFKEKDLFCCGSTIINCIAVSEPKPLIPRTVLLINVAELSEKQETILQNVLMRGKEIKKSHHSINMQLSELHKIINELSQLASQYDYLVIDMPTWLLAEFACARHKSEYRWAEYSILLPIDNNGFHYIDGQLLT